MVLVKPMLCVQGGPGLPEQAREVPAGSRTSDCRAQLGSLLQGAVLGQTPTLEVHRNSCLRRQCCPHWSHQSSSEAQPSGGPIGASGQSCAAQMNG